MSVVTLAFFVSAEFSKARVGSLKVYFFDVGQGDSILIRTPEGKDILIDGGPNSAVIESLGKALPFWDRHIDMVILTHPHDDHILGLYDVLKRYRVDQVLEPSIKEEPENMIYLNELTDKEVGVFSDNKINLGEGLILDFLYPLSLDIEEENLNDTSLVFKLSYGGIDFLFTGDATEEVEAKALGGNLDSEFLKVGHHGSRYSSSQEFLEKVSPLVSIISVGEGNSFGHPTRDTLDRLASVGSRVLRTDISGTVEVEVENDGKWEIKCSKGCK